MRKISKLVLLLLIGASISGCFNNSVCDCPDVEIDTEEIILEVNDQLSELYKESSKHTLSVFVYDDTFLNLVSTGSGFVYKEETSSQCLGNVCAYVFTNAHVVKSYTKIEVMFHNKVRQYADIVRKDDKEDIAILRIDKSENYEVATLSDSSTVERGERVYTIGSPLGSQYAGNITSGIISGVNIPVDVGYSGTNVTMYLLQIDAPLNSGNSGGPLFNSKGEVIGINTLKITKIPGKDEPVESFNFAIPINFVRKVEDALVNSPSQSYTRPKVGISFSSIPSFTLARKESLFISSNVYHGLYIDSVTGSNPLTAGVPIKKIISKVNGINISIDRDFYVEIYKFSANDNITITVIDLDGGNPTNYTFALSN